MSINRKRPQARLASAAEGSALRSSRAEGRLRPKGISAEEEMLGQGLSQEVAAAEAEI